MNDVKRIDPIWWMALGYFVSYVPYTLLTKSLTNGVLPGQTSVPTGLQILPVTMMTTALMFPLIITILGWWKYASRATVLGMNVPAAGRLTLGSGIAFAVVIGTTTIAYSFRGISIVFALLLMRGGVLVMAPIVDALHHRHVRWYSWAALAISFVALGIAFADVGGYNMTIAALVNLAAHLTGYSFRFRHMTALAKIADPALGRRYLVEETMGASLTLLALPVVFALVLPGAAGAELRFGLTGIFTSGFAVPAMMIGGFYGILGTFCTLVYLNPRENTFAIPVNCCAVIFAGVAAAWASVWLFGTKPPATSQLEAAGVITVAILFLSVPSTLELRKRLAAGVTLSDRLFVFVCSGNTSRSPMAQAICNAEATRRLLAFSDPRHSVQAISAGLDIQPGAPATALARSTIEQLGLPSLEHTTRKLTRETIWKAEVIFCMTESQRATVVRTYPEAAWKTFRLDAEDIEDPSKHGPDVYLRVAERLKVCIDKHLDSIGLPAVRAASA